MRPPRSEQAVFTQASRSFPRDALNQRREMRWTVAHCLVPDRRRIGLCFIQKGMVVSEISFPLPMPRSEEEDIQLLLAIALAGGAISLRDDLEMRSYERLQDLGWGKLTRSGPTRTFGLTEEGAIEANKIARRRKLT